ncbi:hypothetical protein SAMN05216382_2970 [Sphingomonas palmae]|uniref:Uncharacterized protein n=1 Tax=Sphingomonas palmae TaxID=1855283 RepID=A0A1H7UEI9_9SPHN|nr:hypothetical protein [Sphingomonas palmae]SEL95482.1 hypothetical protein SAMN05216382_2970 [Sphingomonas palmae]
MKTGSNLALRGRSYYYRASYSSNRKTFSIRLSLETTNPVVARERAGRIDLALKERWRQVTMDEVGTGIGLSDAEKKAIMVAHALQFRRNSADIDAAYSARAYPNPGDRLQDHVRGLRCLDVVHRDIAVNGIDRPFETQAYEEHVLRRWPECNDEERRTLRGVARGAHELVGEITDLARQWVAYLGRAETPINVAAAVRQLALGALVAIKEEIGRAENPDGALDAFLDDNALASGLLENLFDAVDEHSDEPGAKALASPAAAPTIPTVGPVGVAVPINLAPEVATGMTIREAADAFLAAHPRYDDDAAQSTWAPKTRS